MLVKYCSAIKVLYMGDINSANISVVVQGPIVGASNDSYENRYTLRCLESIREHLPMAEIVLSTWDNSDVRGLDYDVCVFNTDPGGHIFHKTQTCYNNVNRQIVSTKAGLEKASRPYVAKIRSDMVFLGNGFLRHFGKFPARHPEFSILKEKVLSSTVYARNPRREFPFPFHPSDWFFFGFKEDVLNIWDIPLATEPLMSRFFEYNERPFPDLFPHFLNRYFPEQYIWLSFLRKFMVVECDYYADVHHDAFEISEKTLASNLVLLEPADLQIRFLKYNTKLKDWLSLYTHGEWLRLYHCYCDQSFDVGVDVLRIKKNLFGIINILRVSTILNMMLSAILRIDPDILVKWEDNFPKVFLPLRRLYRYIDKSQ